MSDHLVTSPSRDLYTSGIVVRNEKNQATVLIKDVLPGPLNIGDLVVAKHSAKKSKTFSLFFFNSTVSRAK